MLDGIDPIVAIIGVFGIIEVFHYLAQRSHAGGEQRLAHKGKLMPSAAELKQVTKPIARGSLIGFVAGLLPGSGSTPACCLRKQMVQVIMCVHRLCWKVEEFISQSFPVRL